MEQHERITAIIYNKFKYLHTWYYQKFVGLNHKEYINSLWSMTSAKIKFPILI